MATVSTQYSIRRVCPSPSIARTPVAESKAVIEAVRERLPQVPAGERPRMVVFGESLGAFGASGAFEDLADLLRRTDGAMFQGPPNATSLWQRYTDDRQPGSPEHLPVYEDGRRLRWANQPQDLASPPEPFAAPRIVYLQNSSDPVVWWSPATIWSRPDWLAEPRANGVLPGLPWLPVVTFIGLSGDMMDSQSVPAGHGHVRNRTGGGMGGHPPSAGLEARPDREACSNIWADEDTADGLRVVEAGVVDVAAGAGPAQDRAGQHLDFPVGVGFEPVVVSAQGGEVAVVGGSRPDAGSRGRGRITAGRRQPGKQQCRSRVRTHRARLGAGVYRSRAGAVQGDPVGAVAQGAGVFSAQRAVAG